MIKDIFKTKQYKADIQSLQERCAELEKYVTPEIQNAISLEKRIKELSELSTQYEKNIQELVLGYNQIDATRKSELANLNNEIEEKKKELITFNDSILVQEFGLYEPRYDFANSSLYKDKLDSIRDQQKACIKNNTAVLGNTDWTVNGSVVKGRKMVKDMQKLLLRAFNSECDETIGKIKYNNVDTSIRKIENSSNAVSKLGATMGISISKKYFDLKVQEAYLAFEYRQEKFKEKEEAKEARAQLREAAKLQKEIEEQRKKFEKEKSHYSTALSTINRQLEYASVEERTALLEKKSELEQHLDDIEISLKDIDYREANQRAGYVYVISNVGSFGENIYKIGMTRRLDPQDRVDELGDASVPFNFDVHAMIFSDDAPALEAALHRAFEDRKVNMVNQRREFFNVTLDEIKDVIKKNFDKTVEFVDVPDAEQYHISEKMRAQHLQQL